MKVRQALYCIQWKALWESFRIKLYLLWEPVPIYEKESQQKILEFEFEENHANPQRKPAKSSISVPGTGILEARLLSNQCFASTFTLCGLGSSL
jgi:hypothetical protein